MPNHSARVLHRLRQVFDNHAAPSIAPDFSGQEPDSLQGYGVVMLMPGSRHRSWIAIIVAVLAAAWIISAGIGAIAVWLLFPNGFLLPI
jgi:hypothetical protein